MHSGYSDFYQQLRQYLTEHPIWIILLVWFISGLEGIAVVGAVVPAVAMLFGLSMIAGTVDISPVPLVLAGAVGAMMGDGLSYSLGRHFKHGVERVWPFRTHPQWLTTAEAFVNRNGGKSLLLGRFIGPLRGFVPLATGIFQMPLRRYLLASLIAVSAWAPVHILPGYFIGSAVNAPVLPDQAQFVFLGALLVTVVVLTGLIPWAALVTTDFRKRFARHNSGLLYTADECPENQLLALFMASISLLGFTALVLTLPAWQQTDHTISGLLFGLRQPPLDHLFIAFSLLGDRPALTVIGTLLCVWLVARREWNTLMHVVAAMAAALLVPYGLKHLFATPRPHFLMASPPSYAFPSGHAFSAITAWGFVYVVLARQVTRELRPWLLGFVIAVIVLTSASRVYLGVHWLSDIIGGLLLGVVTLALLRWSWYRSAGLRVVPAETVFSILMAIAFSVVLEVMPAWPFAWVAYEPVDAHGHIIKRVPVKHIAKPHHKHRKLF